MVREHLRTYLVV